MEHTTDLLYKHSESFSINYFDKQREKVTGRGTSDHKVKVLEMYTRKITEQQSQEDISV